MEWTVEWSGSKRPGMKLAMEEGQGKYRFIYNI